MVKSGSSTQIDVLPFAALVITLVQAIIAAQVPS
jgi:hypothetical protein